MCTDTYMLFTLALEVLTVIECLDNIGLCTC